MIMWQNNLERLQGKKLLAMYRITRSSMYNLPFYLDKKRKYRNLKRSRGSLRDGQTLNSKTIYKVAFINSERLFYLKYKKPTLNDCFVLHS